MARLSMKVKNEKRRELAKRYFTYRKELRKRTMDMKLSLVERQDAMLKLQKLPRDTSRIRVINRCGLTGRSRGFLRKFGLSRIAVRDLASKGMLPGVIKASW